MQGTFILSRQTVVHTGIKIKAQLVAVLQSTSILRRIVAIYVVKLIKKALVSIELLLCGVTHGQL
jgi:hypothetical protein